MALRRKTAESGSGDDSDAPEAVSFGASKKTARGERDAVQRFHAEEKLKAKEKNRARDAALKARAASSKVQGKRKAAEEGRSAKRVRVEAEDDGSDDGEDGADSEGATGGPSRQELEARMARAMMDAEDEEDEDRSDGHSALGELSDGEADTEDEDEMDEDADEDTDEGGEDDGTSDDENMVSEEEEDQDDDDDDEASRQKTNYLPDHLFKTALSNSTPKSSKITFDNDTPSRIPPSKKPRRRKGPKDIVLGYGTSRVMVTVVSHYLQVSYYSDTLEPFVSCALRCHAHHEASSQGGEIREEEPQRERRCDEVEVKRLDSTTRCVYAHLSALRCVTKF